VEFIPSAIDRPATIADLIAERFRLARHAARSIVAQLHGFSEWTSLATAIDRGPASTLDDTVAPDIAELRLSFQAAVIGHRLMVNPHVALRAATELAASGSREPRLGPIETDAGRFEFMGRTNRFSARQARQQRRQNERLGAVGAGLLATGQPTRPLAWIETLTQQFEFPIENAKPYICDPLALIGEIRNKNARLPLYLCGHAHIPGADNPATSIAEREIARMHSRALLLFQHPLVWTANGELTPTTKTVLYGGRSFRAGRWTDFLLGAGGYSALRRSPPIDATLVDSSVIDNQATERAAQAAIAIARGNAHGQAMQPFVLPSPTNWAILLCLDPSAIEALHLTEEP